MTRRFLMAIVGAAFMFAMPVAALAQNFGGYGGGSYVSGGGYGCASNPQVAQLMQKREDLNNQISQADYYHDYNSAHQFASQLDSVIQQIGQLGPNGCAPSGSGYSQNQPSFAPSGSPQQYMSQGNGYGADAQTGIWRAARVQCARIQCGEWRRPSSERVWLPTRRPHRNGSAERRTRFQRHSQPQRRSRQSADINDRSAPAGLHARASPLSLHCLHSSHIKMSPLAVCLRGIPTIRAQGTRWKVEGVE
ncbi:MAG TPA: hypothetical protein VGI36_19240 [Candidatus Binataceae bacterium]|jgi:hypothetical protein